MAKQPTCVLTPGPPARMEPFKKNTKRYISVNSKNIPSTCLRIDFSWARPPVVGVLISNSGKLPGQYENMSELCTSVPFGMAISL